MTLIYTVELKGKVYAKYILKHLSDNVKSINELCKNVKSINELCKNVKSINELKLLYLTCCCLGRK